MSSYAGTLETAKEISDWFIMDIGFSSNSKSCGVCIVEQDSLLIKDDFAYGAMLREFKRFVELKEKIGIIIEAPLSLAFQKAKNPDKPTLHSGSPIARKQIEIEDKTKYRYWYNGAGSMVTLSTIHFLYEIKNYIANKEVYFYEGFVSFKNSMENEKKPTHCDDAEALYKGLLHLKNHLPSQPAYIIDGDQNSSNTNLVFTGDYVGITLANKLVPPVIKIADIANISTSTTLHEQQKP